MTVLFSPVGTADPMTQLGDGPLLHIVRHCNPDKVALFLSPKMARYQRRDGLYTKALSLLAESLGREEPEVELIESSFEEVYRFDHYISEFEDILANLAVQGDGDPILVNVSSGTPAMEQALVALGAFGRLDLKLLQVTTPRKDTNKKHDREDIDKYDLPLLWEMNEDRLEGAQVRVHEVETPNFGDRLLRENIVALIRQYDYAAAYELSEQMRKIAPEAKELLRAASDRLNLNGQLPAKVFGGTPLAYRPNDLLSEYLSVMEVRLAQGHWAEFVRSMTPALTETIENCLDRAGLPRKRYLKDGKESDQFDFAKIEKDEKLSDVLARYKGGVSGKPSYVTNDALIKLVDSYCGDDDARRKVKVLRAMERGCRNPLAHTLKSSDREQLEREGERQLEKERRRDPSFREAKLSLDCIMSYFADLHGAFKPGLYDRINELIASML